MEWLGFTKEDRGTTKRMLLYIICSRQPPLCSTVSQGIWEGYWEPQKCTTRGSCPTVSLICEALQTSDISEDSPLDKGHLKRAGVDTNTFKAHSVRGASTSAAVGKGLHIADVLKTADWPRESTFWQFYYRSSSSAEKNFAQTVLGTQAELLLGLASNRDKLSRTIGYVTLLYIYIQVHLKIRKFQLE